MKKILISIMIIAVVAAVAAGGTVAYFSSESTLPSNFSTATFDVNMAPQVGYTLDFAKLIPGADPQVSYVELRNDGDVAAWVRAQASMVAGSNEALYNALMVKVTVLAPANGGTYPGAEWVSYPLGPLSALLFDNVTAGNPIQPDDWARYKVEVSLPFDANVSQGAWAGATITLKASQSPGNPVTGGDVKW